MKKSIFFSVLILLCILTIAQAPEYFNYQVVVRDGISNDPLTDQDVSFRMSILKGSTAGESQYSELHSTNTGALGIVNLMIGNGTGKTGNLTTIDWGADIYFLKVEIDKTGGSSHVEMGTTQLLSVPYALYAKSVNSYTETDPNAVLLTGDQTVTGNKTFTGKLIVAQQGIGTDAPDESSALEISSTTQGFLPPRMNMNQMEALIPAEGLIVYNTSIKMLLYYNGTKWVKMDGSDIFKIGQVFQGGRIFYIDNTLLHGLIWCEYDDSGPLEWGCSGTSINGADGIAIGTGNQNTIDIDAGCTTVGNAADYCANLNKNGYDDWFLPSIDELKKLFRVFGELEGSQSPRHMWTSTEYDSDNANTVHTFDELVYQMPKSTPYAFIPVRAF